MTGHVASAGDDFGTPIDYLFALVDLDAFEKFHVGVNAELERDDRAGLPFREIARRDRIAMSRDSRARRQVEGRAARSLDGVLPQNLRGLSDLLMTTDRAALHGLLADLRGVDEPIARPVPRKRLLELVTRRLERLPIGNTDGKYLLRTLSVLNPPSPVALAMAGGLGVGATAHRSATSAAVGSYVAGPAVGQHPLTGVVVSHEPNRLVVRLDERFTLHVRHRDG